MPTNGTPPPIKWPIEQTTLYVVAYYETNAIGQAPSNIQLLMRTYNEAVDKAKELITNANNVGVCTIQMVTTAIVYPSIPWEDF